MIKLSVNKTKGLFVKLWPALLYCRFWFEWLFSGTKSYRAFRETGSRAVRRRGSEMLICVCTFTTTLWESPVTRFTPSALGSLYVVGTQLTVVAISTHLAVDTNTSLAVTLGAPVITRTQNTMAKWTTSIYFTSKPWQIRAIAIYKQIFTCEIWASETKGRYKEIIIGNFKKMEKQKRIRIKYTSRLGSFIKGLLPGNRRFSLYLCHTHTHSFQKTRMLTHTGVQ